MSGQCGQVMEEEKTRTSTLLCTIVIADLSLRRVERMENYRIADCAGGWKYSSPVHIAER